METEDLKPIVEALIFASDHPLTIERMTNILDGIEKAEIREAVSDLIEDYDKRGGGLFIEKVAGGFQLRTRAEHAPWLKRLFKSGTQKISKAAMEAMSIIAYKQPCTRGELEAIRGVDSGGVLKKLMDKRLIKIVGRKDTPGRPAVYGTTREFLEAFELKDLSSLPTLKDITIEDTGQEEIDFGDHDLERREEDPGDIEPEEISFREKTDGRGEIAPGEITPGEITPGEITEDNSDGGSNVEEKSRDDDPRRESDGIGSDGENTRSEGGSA